MRRLWGLMLVVVMLQDGGDHFLDTRR